jgi:hypothetical protein
MAYAAATVTVKLMNMVDGLTTVLIDIVNGMMNVLTVDKE